ncbi:hypothetical protein SpCBS45565_g07305 [Spizellomyces sp. 'palustris']|nr:hypothetical protein SpCBS45565_g07305 [Spizellomyces sp. 'palustris']
MVNRWSVLPGGTPKARNAIAPVESHPSLTQSDFENLTRLYALVAHRARRLAILHRHKDHKALVTSYQELVIDCHSLLALVEERYFPSRTEKGGHQFATWAAPSGHHANAPRPASDLKFPGAKQLALIQAVGTLKDALNTLSRTIRRISSGTPPPGSEITTKGEQDPLDRDLATVLTSARSILDVASKFEPSQRDDHRALNKRASLGSIFSRFGNGSGNTSNSNNSNSNSNSSSSNTNKLNRSFSDPVTVEEARDANGSSGTNVKKTLSLAKESRKRRSGQVSERPTSDPLSRDFRNALSVLSQLTTVIGSNLQEFRLLQSNISNSTTQLDHKLVMDMEVLERCYEDALDQLVPLSSSLATLWEQAFVGSIGAIQRLRQSNAEKDQEMARLTRQCEEFQKMNTALLEENTLLKRDMEFIRRTGMEPCATPMSEDMRSIISLPLPSPALELELVETDLVPSAMSSVVVSPPELDYVEIVEEQTNHSDAVVLNRLYSEVREAQALLDDVEKRRRSVMGSLDRPARPRSEKTLTLPRIASSAPLWHDFFPQDPKAKACAIIQARWRGYRARKAFKGIKLRLMIVNEMLDTEASYVKGLLTIHKEFMIPLKEEMNQNSSIISRKDYDCIFRHVEEIMAFNQLLLDDLVERVAFWHFEQVLGDIFIRAAESMKIYAHFVNNYDQAVETLNRVSENPAFEKKLQDISKNMGTRAPDLTDLLITPVQRPPRYLLMLKELLKRTPSTHPDHNSLTTALQKMERTVQIINERKKRFEMMKKVQDMVIGSPFELATPGRYLTHQGPLLELNDQGPAADSRTLRTVFLFTDLVVCAEEVVVSGEKKAEFRWALPVGDVVGIQSGSKPEDGLCIRLSWKSTTSLGVKVFYALGREEHKHWTAILNFAQKNSTKLARQSSLLGTGLILPHSDGTKTQPLTLQNLQTTLTTLQSQITHETQLLNGFTVLENLVSQRGDKGVGMVHRQRDECFRRLGVLRGEVLRREVLRRELEGLD